MHHRINFRSKYLVFGALILLIAASMFGCSGSDGANGTNGTNGPTTGTITGTVLTSTGAPIANTTVSVYSNNKLSKVTDSAERFTLSRAIVAGETPVATTTTGGDGKYTLGSVPPGSYTITFTNPNYTIGSIELSVIAGATMTVNAGMGSSIAVASSTSGAPTVVLSASDDEVGFGNNVTLTATATSPITGVTLTYAWTGATATSGNPTTATLTMTTLTKALAGVAAPSSDPGGFTAAYVQENRIGVLPITPDSRGAATGSVKVSDGQGGSTTASVALNATGVQTGLKNVSVGIPVYLNSGHTDPSSWTMTTKPAGSTATLNSAATRNAWFKPDVAGKYTVAEGSNTMDIYAGKYVGAISGGGKMTVTIPSSGEAPVKDSKGNVLFNPEVGVWATAAGTYTNWPTVTPNPNCTVCHDNSIPAIGAPDMFTPWKYTAHANFFARGLENITSNSGTCLTCHTAGYDTAPSAKNDGFFAMQTLEKWAYPAVKQAGNWLAMLTAAPQTVMRSNIQCENCHGPQSDAHKTGATTKIRIGFSSELCATCHASGTGHHFYSEWNTLNPDSGMGHSKLAQMDATGYAGHARSTSVSCARCHTANGFAAYVDQLAQSDPSALPVKSVTWTQSTAYPQTCTACHDPHNATNPNQLRIYDSIPNTMGGFGVSGLGKGAICVACHNNRNGVKCKVPLNSLGVCPNAAAGAPGSGSTSANNDINYIGSGTFLHEDTDATAALYLDTMHDASQAEVLMGRDVFFMGTSLPMISKHASVKDSCVGCHMTNNPSTHLSHAAPAVSSHTFYITDAQRPQLCAACHSASVDGEALVSFVENAVENTIPAAIAANLKARTVGQTIYVGKTAVTVTSSTVVTLPADSSTFSFKNGTAAAVTGGLTAITTDAAGTVLVFGPNDRLKKAVWNVLIVARDGSKGIHNPTFITAVINNTIAAMSTLTP